MKEKKKGWKKNKDLLVSSRWRRAAECPPGSQAPGRPWQTLWEREKYKESREFAMEWEIGRRMTARTRGGQGEVQWGLGRWIGGGLWWFCGCWWGVSAGWFGAAPATESCLWVCHWLCVIPKKKLHHQTLINSPPVLIWQVREWGGVWVTRGLHLPPQPETNEAALLNMWRSAGQRWGQNLVKRQGGFSKGFRRLDVRPPERSLALAGNP